MKATATDANRVLSNKARALVAELKSLLGAGAPLSVKRRKVVMVRSIRRTPAFVTAAIETYAANAAVLGGDLDVSAARDAQDFVNKLTPVLLELQALATAFSDRMYERKASGAEFAGTVYRRMRGQRSMPQAPKLASSLHQLEQLAKTKRRPTTKRKTTAG